MAGIKNNVRSADACGICGVRRCCEKKKNNKAF
jgi:hypothetical protein